MSQPTYPSSFTPIPPSSPDDGPVGAAPSSPDTVVLYLKRLLEQAERIAQEERARAGQPVPSVQAAPRVRFNLD